MLVIFVNRVSEVTETKTSDLVSFFFQYSGFNFNNKSMLSLRLTTTPLSTRLWFHKRLVAIGRTPLSTDCKTWPNWYILICNWFFFWVSKFPYLCLICFRYCWLKSNMLQYRDVCTWKSNKISYEISNCVLKKMRNKMLTFDIVNSWNFP